MIKFLLIAISILALTVVISVLIARSQSKRLKATERHLDGMHNAFSQMKEKAERFQKALGEIQKAEEAANAERKELAQTLDSDLVKRANTLFI